MRINENKVKFIIIGAASFPFHGYSRVTLDKVKGKIGSERVFFSSLDDLIKMKKSAGRRKDKEDLRILIKLRTKKQSLTKPQRTAKFASVCIRVK